MTTITLNFDDEGLDALRRALHISRLCDAMGPLEDRLMSILAEVDQDKDTFIISVVNARLFVQAVS